METLNAPFRVNFDTNPDLCNLACPMCARFSPHADRRMAGGQSAPSPPMEPEVILRVFQELASTCFAEAVSTSMGEPLLYHGFPKLLEACREANVLLHVTTNGTFPKGGAGYWAERLMPLGADLKISINGASDEVQSSVMPGAGLGEVVSNVKTVVAVRERVVEQGGPRSRLTLKTTFMKTNVRELPELVALAQSLGFDRVRGSHLMGLYPETRALQLTEDADSRAVFNEMVEEAKRVALAGPGKTGHSIALSGFDVLSETESPLGPCPYLGKEVWIEPDGTLAPCCLPKGRRPEIPGAPNVGDAGVLPVWRGADYGALCREYRTLPECAACSRRRCQEEAVDSP